MILLQIIACLILNTASTQTICPVEEFKATCVQELGENYVVVKTFQLDSTQTTTNGYIEHSFVLSKGTQYKISFCDENGVTENVEIVLLNPEQKEIISNYNSKKETYDVLSYTCETTGVHYLRYKLKNNVSCGLSVLGFHRD